MKQTFRPAASAAFLTLPNLRKVESACRHQDSKLIAGAKLWPCRRVKGGVGACSPDHSLEAM